MDLTAYLVAFTGTYDAPQGLALEVEDGGVRAAIYDRGNEYFVSGECQLRSAGNSYIIENKGTPNEGESFRITLFRAVKPTVNYEVFVDGHRVVETNLPVLANAGGGDSLIHWPGDAKPQFYRGKPAVVKS